MDEAIMGASGGKSQLPQRPLPRAQWICCVYTSELTKMSYHHPLCVSPTVLLRSSFGSVLFFIVELLLWIYWLSVYVQILKYIRSNEIF